MRCGNAACLSKRTVPIVGAPRGRGGGPGSRGLREAGAVYGADECVGRVLQSEWPHQALDRAAAHRYAFAQEPAGRGRSARPRNARGARRCRRSPLVMAAARRLGETGAGRLQNLLGHAQLAHLEYPIPRALRFVYRRGRTQLLCSPCRTPRGSVSATLPSSFAIDSIAAYRDGYGSFTSKTMRTTRSRICGNDIGDFLTSAPLSIAGAASKTGAGHAPRLNCAHEVQRRPLPCRHTACAEPCPAPRWPSC